MIRRSVMTLSGVILAVGLCFHFGQVRAAEKAVKVHAGPWKGTIGGKGGYSDVHTVLSSGALMTSAQVKDEIFDVYTTTEIDEKLTALGTAASKQAKDELRKELKDELKRELRAELLQDHEFLAKLAEAIGTAQKPKTP